MSEDSTQQVEPGDIVVPRWIQIPVGLVLGLLLIICMAGSLMMVFMPNEKAPLLAPIFGVGMAFVSLWALGKCVRLVSGKRLRGGLISPRALRLVSWLFLMLPIGGVFSGYFVTHTLQAILQTVAYVGFFLGIRTLAAQREARDA